MSSCESEYRFHFEIVVIVVIAFIIYAFVSIAWVAGQFLWKVQEKVNQHHFAFVDQNRTSQFNFWQRSTPAVQNGSPDLRLFETEDNDPRFLKLRQERNEAMQEKTALRSALKDANDGLGKIRRRLDAGYSKSDPGTMPSPVTEAATDAQRIAALPLAVKFAEETLNKLKIARDILEDQAGEAKGLIGDLEDILQKRHWT